MDEFLEELAFSDEKLEFFEGRIVAFAGGSVVHGALCTRLIVRFHAASREGCGTYTSDVAVAVGIDAYVFPDVSYSCEPVVSSSRALVRPSVVVEVISPHSGRRDRIEKLRAYGRLTSLEEYLLVDSLARSITVFARRPEGGFSQRDFLSDDDLVALDSLEVRFTLRELYAGLDVPAPLP